ncbi:MAG: phytanoyl-CoA dioxygenase family protein [Myxococcota bacterium]
MAALAESVRHFETHGWVVVRGVLDRDEVQALVRAADRILPPASLSPHEPGVPQLVRPSQRDPAFAEWLANRTAFELAARCLGDARVRALQDALIVKPPRSAARLEWHQDASYFGYLEPLVACSVRLALGPCTAATGGMRVLDRSHTGGLRAAHRFGDARVDEVRPDADCPEVLIELGPGDISLHSAYTFHASFENDSDEPRRTVVTHVCAERCRIATERLPPAALPYFPTLDDGRLDPSVFWPLPVP